MAELLRVENLTIKRKQKLICQNLSFEICHGQYWGILGLNGKGKTTLLQTLSALLPLAAGHIYLKNSLLKKLSRKEIATLLGLLLQEQRFLFSSLVYDVVATGRHSQRRTQSVTQIESLFKALNLDNLAYQNILNLSGGEQQRVAIARILYQNPEIFLLDEPTNQLDPFSRHLVMHYFKKLCEQENRAVVLATHDVNLVEQYCDFVLLFFEDGKVLTGTKETLLNPENLRAIYGCTWSKLENTTWHCSILEADDI
jgi:iron complex transport system ATP-binding protein